MGPDHACVVLANHAMVCRGKNERGQLGVGDSIDRVKLSPILGLQGVATASAGWWHTCAARSDGSVLCWGMNKNGSLGTDDDAEKILKSPCQPWILRLPRDPVSDSETCPSELTLPSHLAN